MRISTTSPVIGASTSAKTPRRRSLTRQLSAGRSDPLSSTTTNSNLPTRAQRPQSQSRKSLSSRNSSRSPRRSAPLSPRGELDFSPKSTPTSIATTATATRPKSPLSVNPAHSTVPALPGLAFDLASDPTIKGNPLTPEATATPLARSNSNSDHIVSSVLPAAQPSPQRSSIPGISAVAYSPSKSSTIITVKPRNALASRGEHTVFDQSLPGSAVGGSRDNQEQDKKTMLSRALQKAHTAVLLDNAQNFEGAIGAYGEACNLLSQVLVRSSGEDDRKKLDAIRTTYTNRVQELLQLDIESQISAGKILPARPSSNEFLTVGGTAAPSPDPADGDGKDRTGTMEQRNMTHGVLDASPYNHSNVPLLRHGDLSSTSRPPKDDRALNFASSRDDNVFGASGRFFTAESPMDGSYIPAPLSPRRKPKEQLLQADSKSAQQHSRGSSGASVSWLDTIDESAGSSCESSIHSPAKGKIGRKHARTSSGDTEAEFDAALDAAVEAAYDDGLEPYNYVSFRSADIPSKDGVLTAAGTKVVWPSEREEAITAAHIRDRQLLTEGYRRKLEGSNDDVEDEERVDAMTKDYADGFDFGLQPKSALPRQSDSSSYSGNTWHSSVSSSRTTAMTSLSTVAESTDLLAPKSSGSLSRLSEESAWRDSNSPSDNTFPGQGITPTTQAVGVRSRRMSGQNAKQLKIETSIYPATRRSMQQPSRAAPVPERLPEQRQSNSATPLRIDLQTLPDSVFKPLGSASSFAPPPPYISQSESPLPAISPATIAFTTSLATSTQTLPPPGPLRKNKSSISLRNKALSISSPDGSEVSVGTPISTTFSAFSSQSRKPLPILNALPTPSVPAFGDSVQNTSVQSSNINLFESDLHSPYVPGSPNPLATNAPIPLEPCPESHLLRPFWLMRCFYQTIAHPRGGYLSTKLFVPRDVWRVKGVKIRGIDDKIANLDLLTAALQRLGTVDTLDADAVLEEIQALEQVLDQVQSNLVKKLGSEVGVQGISSLFKDAPASTNETGQSLEPTSNSARAVSQGKSYLTSWRKLRSKSSAVNLTTHSVTKDHTKDTLVLSTLPMTSLPNPRFARRELNQLELSGPHAAYMGSLARLFDAVQVIDQIARQVEDPGLKHSSPTLVGMELSTRHASEFFGFYICRFVLADLTMLLDKFIKRGSEWVLV